MREVTIIGGGISGLTCGWHLVNSGYKVTILEKESILGGLARSFLVKGQWLPLTYHHVLFPDTVTQEYINKFGLFKQLHWIKSTQIFWYEHKPYLLSRPQHILRFRPLDFKNKIRLLYFGLYIYLKKDWDNLAGIDCNVWLNKMVGDKTAELLFQNLMDIKFNMSLSCVSAAWLGRRMHQSVRSRDRYGYIKAGWQELINRITDDIIKRKGQVINNFEVTKISHNNTIEGRDSNGNPAVVPGNIIVSTVPPPVLNTLLHLPGGPDVPLQNITYKSILSFVCSSKKNISTHYWSVVLKPRLIFGGFFNHTVLSLSTNSDGEYIYYFFTYLENNDSLFGYEDDRIKDLYLNDIKKLFPDFDISWYRIFKIKYGQPVFKRDYENPPIELTERLYLAGIYRQFPKPRTMDAAFYSGFETAQYIVNKYGKN